MADPRLVDVLDARDDLLVDADRCFLMESLVLHDVVKKLAILAVLHHQIQFSLCLDDLHTKKQKSNLPHRVGSRSDA